MDSQIEIQSRIPKNFEPEKYTIQLTVDPLTLSYSIVLSVDIYVINPSNYLILNALMNNYSITSLSLKKYDCISDLYIEISNSFCSNVPEYKIEECIYIPVSPEIKLIPNNKLLLTIQLKGTIQIDTKGFYLSYFSDDMLILLKDKQRFLDEFNKSIKLEGGNNRYIKEMVFAVINEPVNCRTIFPCFDEPCYKAIFSFSLILDKTYLDQCPNLKCVTNGDLITVEETNQSQFEFTYSDTPIMSSYLFTLVIGSYDFLETKYNNEIKIRVFTPVNQQRDGALAMELAHKSIKYYESYFDIPYMCEKIDLICVPKMDFRAIENWGCIVFVANAMLFSHFQSILEKILIMRTIVHEISHMWFGNLVTMEWWNDIWLNEGFARLFEFLFCINIMPEYPFWDFFCEYVREEAFVLDEDEKTHPVNCTVPSPRDISKIFDYITYSKGANIIRMLYEYIGEDLFKQSIRVYLKRYQYKNTTTEDLWSCFNETTHQDISSLMNSWLEISGHPVVDIDLANENNKWVLKINQKPYSNTMTSLWTIPLFIKTIDNEYPIVLKGESMTIPIQLTLDISYDDLYSKKNFIVLNSNMKGYYRVNYKNQLLYDNLFVIQHSRITSLDFHSLLSYRLVQKDYCGCIDILNKIRPIKNKLLLSYSLTIHSKLFSHFIPHLGFQRLFKDSNPLPELINTFFIGLIDKAYDKQSLLKKLFINESNAAVYKDQLNDEYENEVLKYLCIIGEDKEIINYIIEKFNTQSLFTHKNLKFSIYEIIMKYTYAYTQDKEKEKKYFDMIYNDYSINFYSNSYYILRYMYSALCKIENSSDAFVKGLFELLLNNNKSDANSHIYSYVFSYNENKKKLIDVFLSMLYDDYIKSKSTQMFLEYINLPCSQFQVDYNVKCGYYKTVLQFILKGIKDKILLEAIRQDIQQRLIQMNNEVTKNQETNNISLIINRYLDLFLNELIVIPIEDSSISEDKAKEKMRLINCLKDILFTSYSN